MPLTLDPMDLAVVAALAEEPSRRLSRRELAHRLVDGGWGVVAPRALLDLPSVTGRVAGRDQVVLVRVAGDDLVLAPVVLTRAVRSRVTPTPVRGSIPRVTPATPGITSHTRHTAPNISPGE
ncbi:hypothetical protein [Clavibacter zhangzhiyongii]|uniref:hypothetical protein n=1 Tax=Clavibacter zhangzhiyongii TaxID=2768071 RepID=UPI0039DFBF33